MTEFKAISKVQIIVTIPLQAGYSYVIFNFYTRIFQTEVTNKVRSLIVGLLTKSLWYLQKGVYSRKFIPGILFLQQHRFVECPVTICGPIISAELNECPSSQFPLTFPTQPKNEQRTTLLCWSWSIDSVLLQSTHTQKEHRDCEMVSHYYHIQSTNPLLTSERSSSTQCVLVMGQTSENRGQHQAVPEIRPSLKKSSRYQTLMSQ